MIVVLAVVGVVAVDIVVGIVVGDVVVVLSCSYLAFLLLPDVGVVRRRKYSAFPVLAHPISAVQIL